MILFITLALAGTPCTDRTEQEQQDFTDGLRALQESVAQSQLDASTKDPSRKAIKQVLAHERKGELCTQEDRFWAAMVLLLAHDAIDAEKAYRMGQALMEEHHPRGAWLAALAYDRMSIAKGALQSYGSQTRVENGKRCLIWTDLQFSDADRVKMGHPELADTIATVLKTNGVTDAKPTVLELKNRGLWCKPEPWDGSRSDLPDPYDGRQ